MNRFSTEHYRRLLDGLRAAITRRVDAENELAAVSSPKHDSSLRGMDQTIGGLAGQLERTLAEAEEQHAAERQSIDAEYQAAVAAANSQHDQQTKQINNRFESELAAVEKKYEEDVWLMSSILDDKSEKSPKYQFEKLKTQLVQSRERLVREWEEIKSLRDQAIAQAEQRRQRSEFELKPDAPPKDREDAVQAFTAAAQIVRAKSALLGSQLLPKLFAGRMWWVLGLVVWGALFGALYVLVDLQKLGFNGLSGFEWPAISGGVTLCLVGAVLFVLSRSAAQQSEDALEPLEQNTLNAKACFDQWQKLAKAELQQAEKEFRVRQAAVVKHREKSLQQFEDARQQRTAELNEGRDRDLKEAATAKQQALASAAQQQKQKLKAAQDAHKATISERKSRFEKEHGDLTNQYETQLGEHKSRREKLARQLASSWKASVAEFEEDVAELNADSRREFPDWETFDSEDWKPPEVIPAGVKLGAYELDLQQIPGALPRDEQLAPREQKVPLPAVLDFPGCPSLLLKASGAGRDEAIKALQTAMLRLLAQLPPGDVRFTVFDPVGLGENFAAFMHLADQNELLINHRVWTDASHIEQQLGNLTEHMENVFQKYLRNDFESIEAYNEKAGEVAEPYRVLVVANFPAGFSERAAQRLVSIAGSGQRCGLYTLISADMQHPMPHGFSLADLESETNVFIWKGGRFQNEALEGEPLPLAIEPPPPPAIMANVIRKVGEYSKLVRRVEVPFHRIAPTEEEYWTGDSRKSIDAPLGRAGAMKLQHLKLGIGTSQHVLLAGKTGSGKSTLLHVIVTDLALRYSPDEVEFYLIDFKKGVEFKTYAAQQLPHARVISIESDREFGVSALERLDAILKDRGNRFRDAGVQDIRSFRDAQPDVPMPRILLLVDEFQEFFVEDDKYSQQAALLLDRLVRQGRAFGMHVLLGSQSLGGAYSLARTTMGQFAVRIALQCSEADAHLILSENNGAARLLTRPGEAIYNDANGMVEGNNPFQIAWLGDNERDVFLARLRALALARGKSWPEPIVFEGNLPADPMRNVDMRNLIENAKQPAPASGRVQTPRVWLGDAVAITGPTSVVFNRRSGANVLIVGQDTAGALGILSNTLIVLASQLRDADETLPRLNLLTSDADTPDQRRWSAILGLLPNQVRVGGVPDAGSIITEIAAEVTRRQQEGGTSYPPIFLIIDDVSNFRELRKGDDDFGFGGFDKEKTVTPGQALPNILRDGPPLGVHTIVWCDSYNNVDRWFSRNSMREFEMRVAFQMSAGDSSSLVDSPAASRLGTNRALIYSDERGTTEKFRPYAAPEEDWLAWLKSQLANGADEGLSVGPDIDSMRVN